MLHPVRILTVLLFACAALAAGLGEARAERRVALVMGNAAYKNPELVLPNARNDAEDVAAALKKLGFEVLLETDVDLAAAGKAIQQFARLAADADASLFFYAGHAVQHQGHNYLLPVDAEINDEISLAFGAVGVDNVRGVLDRAKGVKIMALDACRDNPVAGRLARADNGVSAAPEREARSRGLRRGDRPDEILIAFAAAPGSVAYDGDGRNSPFTKAFLKRLAEPGLEVETLFRRVAGDVIAATDGRQRPETYAALAGDYYLNEADRLAWEKVKDSDDPAVLRDFMERFPSSFHAIEARYRVVALERALAAQKERALREAEAARREKEAAERAAAERLRQETERQRQEAERRRLEQEAAVLRQKQEAACGGERAALAAAPARDPEALRRLLGGACPEAVAAARQRLAELERVLAAEAEACRKEDGALAALGPRDLDGLRAASASTCPA
ncbi:caspase domain-containing protein, partial [Methylocella sp.]|uniref:caspase domain-containing protein n=1 Tax=Methylocella sp. TaxID=1978226 RepID=UPI003783947F